MIKSRIVPQQFIVFTIYLVMILTAINFQTTLWFSVFGFFPSPCLWTPIFTYLMMNRGFPKNILWLVVFFLLFLTQSSAVPLTLLWALLALWGCIAFAQQHVSTLGMFDLILFSAGATLLFPLLYFTFSLVGAADASLDWIGMVISTLLSLPLTPAILFICKKLDATIDPMNNPDNLVLDI